MNADYVLLDALLLDLVHRFGQDAVRARYEQLFNPTNKRRGRPRLRDFDELFQVWLCVKLQRDKFSCWSVTRICTNISKKGGVSHASYDGNQLEIRTIKDKATIRRIYYEAEKLMGSNSAIAKAWDFQLESVLGVDRSPAHSAGRLGPAPAASDLSHKSEKKTLN